MTDERRGSSRLEWVIEPAFTQLEQLEAACRQVVLHAEENGERAALRELLDLVVGSGLNPFAPGERLVKAAAGQICVVAAILAGEKPDPLALRIATERLCQTLTTMRGHLGGGEQTIGSAPRANG